MFGSSLKALIGLSILPMAVSGCSSEPVPEGKVLASASQGAISCQQFIGDWYREERDSLYGSIKEIWISIERSGQVFIVRYETVQYGPDYKFTYAGTCNGDDQLLVDYELGPAGMRIIGTDLLLFDGDEYRSSAPRTGD